MLIYLWLSTYGVYVAYDTNNFLLTYLINLLKSTILHIVNFRFFKVKLRKQFRSLLSKKCFWKWFLNFILSERWSWFLAHFFITTHMFAPGFLFPQNLYGLQVQEQTQQNWNILRLKEDLVKRHKLSR